MLAEFDDGGSASAGLRHRTAEVVFVESVEVGGGVGVPAWVGEGGVVGAHELDDLLVRFGGPDALEFLFGGEVHEGDVVGVGAGGGLRGALAV